MMKEFTGQVENTKGVSLLAHKPKTSVTELVYYLEEMYDMGLANEKETDIYERYTYGMKVSKSEWVYVLNRSHKMFFEKF